MSRRRKEESGEYTPKYLFICRKCGFRGLTVHLGIVAPSAATVQTTTFQIYAACPKCNKKLDEVTIHAAFSGIGSWYVNKSHVG